MKKFSLIQEIILSDDTRSISKLNSHMQDDWLENSSNLVINNQGVIFITTGFYILSSKKGETDGPIGAKALSDSLKMLGNEVYIITDEFSYDVISSIFKKKDIITFPNLSHKKSSDFAKKLLSDYNPSLLISIERAGILEDGTYRNWKGLDFSEYNSKIDYLFNFHKKTIGIGDGGNEIGMGNFFDQIKKIDGLPDKPSVTKTTELIISSVSNWGAYGLLAALSIIKKQNLLPTINQTYDWLCKIVAAGAVDGISGESKKWIDGRTFNEDSLCLKKLLSLV
ncbi:MAG: glutamate cyclase domain-containing protein [Dehalococcoidia bacterium]